MIAISKSIGKGVGKNMPNLCVNCKHFVKDLTPEWKLNHRPNYSNCGLYGKINLINGDCEYETAYEVRNDENKCGIKGKLFEQK
ncbi:MAG: hypothetical protein ACOVO9_13825 [Bacteroidia bacterium]|jgi:hypothetical protein